ncbi:hypothetical protein D3C76_1777490 [compost metagenome]
MYSEISWEGRKPTKDEYDAYYGGEEIARYQSVEDQLTALDRVRSILVSSYLDCTPLRSMFKRLAAARAEVARL